MIIVDATVIKAFLTALGARQTEPAQLSLLGGCALILLGSTRATEDIDYEGDDLGRTDFQRAIDRVASELQLEVEPVPIDRFIPIPSDSLARRVFIGRFGVVDVYVLDPYTIALSKLDRGFHSDLNDVVFLIERAFVNLDVLSEMVKATLPQAPKYNIDSKTLQQNLAIIRERASKN